MEMNGEQRIPADQQTVWTALNDLDVLKASIAGCEAIEKVSESEHHVTLTAAVGPVKAKFKGKMHLEDLDPPNSYRIRFEGQGGVAGFAKGDAAVSLKPDGAGTVMSYTVRAQVGGKLAQVGSRLIDAAARKVADDFFAAFNARVAPAGGAVAETPTAGRIPMWVWAAAAVAAIVVLYFASR
jgi:carbon monoxide dehydrogenase subunit G